MIALVCLAMFGIALGQTAQPQAVAIKRGVGLAERRGMGEKQLELLDVGWYYNWGSQSKLSGKAEFVPMIFSGRHVDDPVRSQIVLGFNEPDHPKQANMPVKEAVELWPKVVAHGKRIGSPAMAGNPVTQDWLRQFLADKPHVDFICVHWYKGANAKRFIEDMTAVHDAFGKPIWVTEFAAQTVASSKESPDKYSQKRIDQFIADTTEWMESSPFIERYAWHDSRVGTSALFDEHGQLTATGRTYASVKMKK